MMDTSKLSLAASRTFVLRRNRLTAPLQSMARCQGTSSDKDTGTWLAIASSRLIMGTALSGYASRRYKGCSHYLANSHANAALVAQELLKSRRLSEGVVTGMD